MKTITLKEARERATQGTLHSEPTILGAGTFLENEHGVMLGKLAESTLCSELNAALLAHCWNHFDELVEALAKAESWMGLHCREDTERDEAALADAASECRAVLQRAKEVEIL